MKKLSIERIEGINGGSACGTFTGAACAATVILLFSAVFAPVAASTAIYCGAGLVGCNEL